MPMTLRLDEAQLRQDAAQYSDPSLHKSVRLDDGESIFFARELEHLKAREEEIDFPELKARMIIPIETDADPAAETITYRQYSYVGAAKIVRDYSDDLPSVDLIGEEFTSRVRSLGASFGYSLQEIRTSQKVGRSIDAKKQRAAVEIMRRSENTILFLGDATHQLNGFLNNSGVPTLTIPNDGTGASKTWATKTNDQILRDLQLMLNTVNEQTLGIETANVILLPLTSLNYIKQRRLGAGDGTLTVLKFFLENNPGVSVDWLNELETAGVGPSKRMMAFKRSPDKVGGQIPQDYEQLPAQPVNMSWKIACHSRVGGVIFYKPWSAVYGDGI